MFLYMRTTKQKWFLIVHINKSLGCLLITKLFCTDRNLEIDGYPFKENIFGQSALLIDTVYIVFH